MDLDFNDIQSRIARINASINAMIDNDVKKHTNIEIVETDNGKGVSLTFGKDDQPTVENKIVMILYNLATLKDNLKACLERNGKSGQIVEDELKNSLHMQVVTDLANQYNHSVPLTWKRHSGKNLLIKNMRQDLALDGVAGSSTEITIGEDGHIISYGTPPYILISADIYDDQGTLLFNLNTLIETCLSKYENIARTNNCI